MGLRQQVLEPRERQRGLRFTSAGVITGVARNGVIPVVLAPVLVGRKVRAAAHHALRIDVDRCLAGAAGLRHLIAQVARNLLQVPVGVRDDTAVLSLEREQLVDEILVSSYWGLSIHSVTAGGIVSAPTQSWNDDALIWNDWLPDWIRQLAKGRRKNWRPLLQEAFELSGGLFFCCSWGLDTCMSDEHPSPYGPRETVFRGKEEDGG